MRSPAFQYLLILAVLIFVIAFAMTVSLLCVTYLRGGEEEESSADLPVLLPTAAPDEDDNPIPLGNGLRYRSAGNGTCTLIGIGNCADACVVIPDYSPSGDRVTAVAETAFYGCESVTAIQIPSSVTSIGARAFAACPNLVYISVNADNRFYTDRDGVLYSRDERVLLLYPPMHAGNATVIGGTTAEIADMAFYGCAYLSRVIYCGSAAEWENVRVGSGNYSLAAASITFYGKSTP